MTYCSYSFWMWFLHTVFNITYLWSLDEIILLWCSAHVWLLSRLLTVFKKWKTSFFQPSASWQATRPVSAQLHLAYHNLKYTVPFFLPGNHLLYQWPSQLCLVCTLRHLLCKYLPTETLCIFCAHTYVPAGTCPTVCLAGKNGGIGALQEATLAGNGHLAVGSLQEDCFGATA